MDQLRWQCWWNLLVISVVQAMFYVIGIGLIAYGGLVMKDDDEESLIAEEEE